MQVKLVGETGTKSVQDTERLLIEKQQAEQAAAEQARAEQAIAEQAAAEEEPAELKEEDVLSYIGKRYNKQINSFDELMSERNNEELPEDVSAFLKYKKETGRGIDDFMELRKDFNSMDEDTLLRKYLATTQDGLDSDDIETLMEDYSFDDMLDDDSDIKKKKIAKKKTVLEAKKYFSTQQEKYKVPLELGAASLSKEEKEEFDAFKQHMQSAKTQQEQDSMKRDFFRKKTDELFTSEFKGFEFNIGENKQVVYSPGDAMELKKNQSSPMNFITKYLDENGLVSDHVGYHRALAAAMNPEKFAKHFYEQGMSDALDSKIRGIKNINMTEQKVQMSAAKTDGIQVKVLNPEDNKLRIRSRK